MSSIDSFSNTSLLHMGCSVNTSLYPIFYLCFQTAFSLPVFTTLATINFLIVPMCIIILWMGFSRCWNEGKEPLSHYDVFVYHMAATEVLMNVGFILNCVSIFTCNLSVRTTAYYLITTTYPTQSFFHCLTCLERYVAVVHPIAYLSLKKSIWFRHVSSLAICVFSLVLMLVCISQFPEFPGVVFIVVLLLVIAVVTFCTLAILHVLINSGLRKVGRKGIDQSKLRAYHHILLITGTLVLRSLGLMIYNVIFMLDAGQHSLGCLVLVFGSLFCLPCSALVPLQYLHRAGVFACFSCKTRPLDK
ncbi:uncharacterized protein LOC103389559 [Cynoglossus semilaevis]|uniref:uncharacterized protein LOC103389559 n=1 Tax=Cynoglossus semilaevis TaxID=244447 RepID=UPI000497D0EB|nr:uncharacterized protein LOC103389559 [Cynoglossus semilaevis]XP_008323244.1 uncharacterized protein LOC103389559 [Cynoglossus semilaevis]